MHALKLGDIEAFPFVEPPDGRYVRDGQRTLRELGALSEEEQLTDTGRQLAKLPLDPRLGRMLLAGGRGALPRGGGDHRRRRCRCRIRATGPADKQTQADQKHAPLRDEQSDFLSLLKLWREYEKQRAQLSRAQAARLVQGELPLVSAAHRMARRARAGDGSREGRARAEAQRAARRNTRLSTARCSRACCRRSRSAREQGEYLGANGTKIFIHPGSGQFKARPAWIVSAEQVETTKVYARNVARVEPAWIEQAGAHLVKRQHYEPHWERRASRAAIYERVTLFGLTAVFGPQRALRADRPEGRARAVHPPRAGATWSTTRARRSSRTT